MTRPATAFVSSPEGAARLRSFLLRLLVLLLAGLAPAFAQEPAGEGEEKKEETPAEEKPEEAATSSEPVIAHHVARVLTGVTDPVEDAVILVQGGKILEIGTRAQVKIPYGAEVISHGDCVAMPGFVHAGTVAFSGADRLNLGGSASRGDTSVSVRMEVEAQPLLRFARAGFTKIACIPSGGGIPGLAAIIEPVGKDRGYVLLADCMVKDQAVMMAAFEPGTATKESWKKNLEKARQYLTDLAKWKEFEAKKGQARPEAKPAEGEKKPEEPKKEGEGEKKPAEAPKPAEEKKAEDPKEPTKDAKLAPLIEHLEGRMPVLLALADAAAFIHFHAQFEAEAAFRPAILEAAPNRRDAHDFWRVADRIKALGVPVVLPPAISRESLSPAARFSARDLLDRGIPVAFVPDSDQPGGLQQYRTSLQEAIRAGLSEAQVLRAATLVPAQVLGIADRCGSIEKGKDADFLLFTGDPWSPTAGLKKVYVRGKSVLNGEEPLP